MKKSKKIKMASSLFALLVLCFSQINDMPIMSLKADTLYEIPATATYVEDLLCLKVGESLNVSLSEGVYAVSSDTNVARVNSEGRIRAVGYGKVKIDFIKDSVTESLNLIVKRDYDSNVLTQAKNFPRTYNGENDLYVYRSDNGDIENDLVNGLSSMALYGAPNNEGSYWNNISFIGADHFGGRGTGALSYKAIYPGNYTFDYSAWLLSSLRINSDYNSWNIDGFTTGLAKKSTDGSIEILVSNVGTKQSVVDDETRYQMGTYTLDLESGEEVMMFFCSNGNGDCDEVYCDFAVIQNEITGTPLYVLPSEINRFESYPMINIGETLDVSPREGASIVSSNTNVIEIDANKKLVAKDFGNATITITEGEDTVSFEVFTNRKYSGNYVSLSNSMPTSQGDNNLYIYGSESMNLDEALSSMELLDNSFSSTTQWWNNKIFVNNERVFCNGTGAISFKSPLDGNYTIDYSSWLKSDVRVPQYLEWDTDGFTSGLAKKDVNGNIEVLVKTVGTKESVMNINTMRHSGSVTIDLAKDEEIMYFFNSNATSDADEIMATFVINNNISSIYNGSLEFSNTVEKISDVGLIYLNQTTQLQTNYEGKISYSSSNEQVATVDENGLVTAKGVGVTVLKAYDSFAYKQLVLAVKSENESEIIFSQAKIPSKQGENNTHIYYHENGNIEDDLAAGLKNVRLLDNKYYNASEKSWWESDNRVVFINQARVFTSGIGMLAYTVEKTGNYRVDYYGYLLDELRNNPNYGSWTNCDGFTIGIGKKDSEGNITVIDSFINDKNGVVTDETRFMMNECVVNANSGDEIFLFWVSNGIGDCDEIVTDFKIQRVFLENEDKPVTIKLESSDVNLSINQQIEIEATLENYNNQEKVWSSSNESIAKVDENGNVTAISSGICEITLKIGEEVETIMIFVNYSAAFTQEKDEDLQIELDSSFGEMYIYRILLNGTTVSNKNYNLTDNVLTFSNDYLNSLDAGEKKVELITDIGKVEIDLDVIFDNQKPVPTPTPTPTPTPEPKSQVGLIVGLSVGGCVLLGGLAVLFIFLKKKKGA